MKQLFFVLGLACVLNSCAKHTPPSNHPNIRLPWYAGMETEALTAAARRYLKTNAAAAVGETTIVVEKVAGQYARLKVTPAKPTTDPATLYLRRSPSGGWEGVTIGTGWSPEDYATLHIPQEIQN